MERLVSLHVQHVWHEEACDPMRERTPESPGAAVGSPLDLKEGKGLWAIRSKIEPIRARRHQVNTVKYIAAHARRGAALYLHPRLKKSRESEEQ